MVQTHYSTVTGGVLWFSIIQRQTLQAKSNINNFNQASSLGLEQPVSWAEDCTGMLCVDICERIIWAIFEYTKLYQHFDPEGSLQANTTLGDAALYNTSREVSI